jgi:predicted MFS family arabinose efflux permease
MPVTANFARIPATPLIIGLIGFLTLVDLFAAQAILPSLAERYGAAPSEIGFAVNASTIGMAIAGVAVVFLGGRVNRRTAVWVSLALLAIPTLALAVAPSLAIFTLLRISQGLFMVTAFSMTMSYLAERCSAAQSATALAAYVTGVVASNLVGRFISGTLTDAAGLEVNFVFFAALNLTGAALSWLALKNTAPAGVGAEAARAPAAVIADHLANGCLRTSFGIGFLILFAFIGVFTYVNFVLAAPPIGLSPAALGIVYLVFLPSMATTPLAGKVASRIGARLTFLGSLGLSIAGLPLLVSPHLASILAGLVIVGVGTFFAQATATGFVGRAAKHDRAAASGMYLSSYYLGGLAGAFFLGRLFDAYGWAATVSAVGAALALAGALAAMLRRSTAEPAAPPLRAERA